MNFRIASHSVACSTVLIGGLSYSSKEDFIKTFGNLWHGEELYDDNSGDCHDPYEHSFFVASVGENQYSAQEALPMLGFKLVGEQYNIKNGTTPFLYVATSDEITEALKKLKA